MTTIETELQHGNHTELATLWDSEMTLGAIAEKLSTTRDSISTLIREHYTPAAIRARGMRTRRYLFEELASPHKWTARDPLVWAGPVIGSMELTSETPVEIAQNMGLPLHLVYQHAHFLYSVEERRARERAVAAGCTPEEAAKTIKRPWLRRASEYECLDAEGETE